MTFTSNEELVKLEENVKFQNENGNSDMNQKDLSLLASSPKQIWMVILNQKPLIFMGRKAAGAAFLRCFLSKWFQNSWNIRRKTSTMGTTWVKLHL